MQKKLELDTAPATAPSGPSKDASAIKRAIGGLLALALASCVVAAIPSVAAASPGCDAVNVGAWNDSVAQESKVLTTLSFTENDEIVFWLLVSGGPIGSTKGTLDIYSDTGSSRSFEVVAPAGDYGQRYVSYFVSSSAEQVHTVISTDYVASLAAFCNPGKCSFGSYSASGVPPCTRSPLGYYVDKKGATAPTPAPLGYYVDQEGATAPIPCPAGTTTEQVASTSAADCVDITPPTITWVGGPSPGGSYVYGSVPAAPSCTASDDESGPDTCTVVGYTTSVGTHTMTATATDLAGNVATEARTYTVQAWTLVGFSAPVVMNGALNRIKAGQAVPLQFRAFAGATEITAGTAVKAFTYAEGVSCTALDQVSMEMPIEQVTAGNTVLRYDAVNGYFIQNWQTRKSQRGSCYRVTMTTADASSLVAYFKLE